MTKRAAKLYGHQNSEEKQKWISEEFNRRKNKREQKEKARSEGPHCNGSSGVFSAGGHDFLHQLLPSIYGASEQAATDDIVRMVINCRSSKEMLEQLTKFLVSYPRIVEQLIQRVPDAPRREQLRRYIESQAAAQRQNMRYQQQHPGPPPTTPTGEHNEQANAAFDGMGNLPEGFDAILADIQKQLPVALSEDANGHRDSEMLDAPSMHTFDDLPDLSDDDDEVDVDALLAALQAADNADGLDSSSTETPNGTNVHTRQPSMELENHEMFSQQIVDMNINELSQEDLEKLIQDSGIDLGAIDIDIALQNLEHEDPMSEHETHHDVASQVHSQPDITEDLLSSNEGHEENNKLSINTDNQLAPADPVELSAHSGMTSPINELDLLGHDQALQDHQRPVQDQPQPTEDQPQPSQDQQQSSQGQQQPTEIHHDEFAQPSIQSETEEIKQLEEHVSQDEQVKEDNHMDIDDDDLRAFEGLSGLEDLDSMDPEQIDALLNELRGTVDVADDGMDSESDSETPTSRPPPQQNQASMEAPQFNPINRRSPSPVYRSHDIDTSGQYTPETIAAILRCIIEGLPQVPLLPNMRGVKRPAPGPPAYMHNAQKRLRGPSPHMPGPSSVNQLNGILQNSMDRNSHHGPMPPAYSSSRYPNSDALNKKLIALKPPPYRPAPKPDNPAPVPPPGIGIAHPKKKEDEKRIKAMGFPPLMAGLKRN